MQTHCSVPTTDTNSTHTTMRIKSRIQVPQRCQQSQLGRNGPGERVVPEYEYLKKAVRQRRWNRQLIKQVVTGRSAIEIKKAIGGKRVVIESLAKSRNQPRRENTNKQKKTDRQTDRQTNKSNSSTPSQPSPPGPNKKCQ